MRAFALAGLLVALARPAFGCDTALLLAIDVSGSIDTSEFNLQTEGMAAALTSPEIADALVEGEVALAVVQWSGAGKQVISIGWQRMASPQAVVAFAADAGSMARAYVGSDTAIGDAIAFAASAFGPVADCTRHVIDVSGDGPENSGRPTALARQAAERAGIEINGIAIESMGRSLTGFYERFVITRQGFVVTAIGHLDYARAIKAKILRELEKLTG